MTNNRSTNIYGFISGEKLLLVRNESQTLYQQQYVKYLGFAKEPNQGTAIVTDSNGDFILVRPEFLHKLDSDNLPINPPPSEPEIA